MYLTNAFKVLVSNFHLNYKVLIYRFIVALILISLVVAIVLPSLLPVIDDMKDLGVMDMAQSVFDKFVALDFSGESLTSSVANLIAMASDVLSNHANDLIYTYIVIAVLIFLAFFLNAFSSVPTTEVLYGSMEFQAKYLFSSSLLVKFKTSLKYALLSMVIVLPIDLLIIVVTALILFAVFGDVPILLGFFASMFFIAAYSLRKTIVSTWLAVMVYENLGAWKSFVRGWHIMSEKFGKIYSTQFVLLMIEIVGVMTFGIFTLGVGFIFAPGIILVIDSALSLVIYCNITGKRYYVDYNEIVVPKKIKDKEQNFSYDLNDFN